jgi:hypothetical protein
LKVWFPVRLKPAKPLATPVEARTAPLPMVDDRRVLFYLGFDRDLLLMAAARKPRAIWRDDQGRRSW